MPYNACVLPKLIHREKDQTGPFQILISHQGIPLAEPGGSFCLTFDLGWLENLIFFIEIICWVPCVLQAQSTGLVSIFLGARPCPTKISSVKLYSITLHQYFIVWFTFLLFVCFYCSVHVCSFKGFLGFLWCPGWWR